MTVYGEPIYPELIEQPRMRNQLDRNALQAAEMPDLNGVLRSQSSLMLFQGNGQMITGIGLRGASGGQGLVTLDGVPLFGNFAGGLLIEPLCTGCLRPRYGNARPRRRAARQPDARRGHSFANPAHADKG